LGTQALSPGAAGRAQAGPSAEPFLRAGARDQSRKTTLENGIRVVTEAMPGMRSVALGILVDAGPRDEAPHQGGLAHLTEHVMFQGTASQDAVKIARLIDVAGGQMGAFTARDYTCYSATILDDYLTYITDLLGDILLNSTFPPEGVEREKRAILREMDAHRDSPPHRAEALLKAAVWPDHPLGGPIEGRPDTLLPLTREDVIYFVHENYLPDRMIVAAAGHVDHDDFVAQVRDAFWRLRGESRPAPSRPCRFRPGVVIEHAPISQVYFSLAIEAGRYADPNRYGLHLLNNLLGGGMSSRLFRRIREERGLVYDIHSEYHAYRDGGMLVVEGSAAPEHLIPVLAGTLFEMGRLVEWDDPIDEEELWKAKMQTRGQHLIASENSHTRMSRLATQELYFGRHVPAEEILDQIEEVDCDSLRDLARRELGPSLGRLALAVVGPEAPAHYSERTIRRLLADFQGVAT
jgi:predicted Zn-dependent peptidase